jgi:predicted nucleotidyltransferase
MSIGKQNIAGLTVFGSTFRNEPMLFSVTKIQNIM